MTKRIELTPAGILLAAGLALGSPSLASAATCTIAPQNPTIDEGKSVSWSATYSGFRRTPSYAWTFGGGTPGSSTSRTRSVSYAEAGTFTTSLKLTYGDTTATCSTQVTVRAPEVSINSTSQNSLDVSPTTADPVPEGPTPKNANSLSPITGTGTTGYQVLAINDLGMHCGDLDTRVASILPPFQVLLSQVIQKGAEPKILGPGQAQVVYSAASNPKDPILSEPTDPVTGYPFTGLTAQGDVFKTNFWNIAYQAYNPFYPPGILCNPDVPSQQPPACFAVGPDVGLPVPNVEHLYINSNGNVVLPSTGNLTAVQHAMPGVDAPYAANEPQIAQEHYGDKPFFVNFPFGYVANDLNWFEGAGIPFAAFDDAGRENPYPLVRVQAKNAAGTAVLATVDTVLPISGEASCKNCHGAPSDVPDALHPGSANAKLSDAGIPVQDSTDDPLVGADVPLSVSVEYATDINILRLHDLMHGAKYRDRTGTPSACTGLTSSNPNGNLNCLSNKALVQQKAVVCQVCHYTPALDLAQVGPLGGVGGPADANANGRVQRIHQSNSRVLHMGHSKHTSLFPPMPAPASDSSTNGLPSNQAEREQILEQTCYSCHPGNKTKCMRGAMADGGMVCQDCHGDLRQVGDDFTVSMSPAAPFPAGIDLTKRVPWANEPGCGSCHTGDATSNLARPNSTEVIVNKFDANLTPDNIRLLRAYRTGDENAKPIVPTNKRFAEPVVPASFNGFANPGAGNPKLYRVSTGHGGVMCEGCHGATHAEWDSDGSPLRNDNVTANQLQGHSGTVMECNSCHTTSNMSASTQDGPHGMHLVNESRFWTEAHKGLAKSENAKANGGSCAACHGADHKGTVLSRAPVDRSFTVEGSSRTVKAGEPVSCELCHSLDKSFEGGSSGGGDD